MKNISVLILGFLIFFLLSETSSAQIPEDNTDPGTEPICWPPPCVPVDGGIVFLIAAGAAYGTKKIYDLKKEK